MARIPNYFQQAIAIAVGATTLWGGLPPRLTTITPAAIAQTANFQLSPLERQVLAEMNRARTDPQGYAAWLETMKQYYQGRILKLPNQDTLPTQEGTKAVDEAIQVLQNLSPLPPLSLSPGMSLGARDHLNDVGSKGNIGHYGSDGSQFLDRINRYGESEGTVGENLTYGVTSAEAIVMQMIVDDGVIERYHRENILFDGFSATGVACGEHQRYEQMCVITYSGDFRDRLATTPPSTPNRIENQTTPVVVPIQELPPADPDILPPPPNEPIPIQPPQEPPPSVIPVIEPVESEAASSPVETNNPVAVNPEPPTPREILLEQGILEDGDPVYEQDGSLYDVHQFSGEAGQVLTISVESSEFDTFLAVFDEDDRIIGQNDDLSDESTNSSVQITIPRDGTYRIFINGYDESDRGRYTIRVVEAVDM
ncbi:MAG: CAP domain-containing protein [Spirulinaceae cyanobacterium]